MRTFCIDKLWVLRSQLTSGMCGRAHIHAFATCDDFGTTTYSSPMCMPNDGALRDHSQGLSGVLACVTNLSALIHLSVKDIMLSKESESSMWN
jgi:hypothetical protein